MSQTLDPTADSCDVRGDRIVLRGVVDATVGARLGAMLADHTRAREQAIDVDLSEVEAIDEHGLVAIVRAWHEMWARGRTMRLLDPSPAIGPLLAMTGLTATYSDR